MIRVINIMLCIFYHDKKYCPEFAMKGNSSTLFWALICTEKGLCLPPLHSHTGLEKTQVCLLFQPHLLFWNTAFSQMRAKVKWHSFLLPLQFSKLFTGVLVESWLGAAHPGNTVTQMPSEWNLTSLPSWFLCSAWYDVFLFHLHLYVRA